MARPEFVIPGSQHAIYGQFAVQNPAFIELARAISYWNEHYRRQYPAPASCPAHRLLTDPRL